MRLLIVSNNALEMSNSNGRTLGKLLQDINNDEKIQFCMIGTSVSSELVDECYRISDKDVLKGIKRKKVRATKLADKVKDDTNCTADDSAKVPRTPFTMIARELVWHIGMNRLDFLQITECFQPNAILYMLGDNGFVADLVMQLSEISDAKIVVFTTEDYYFKKWDYLRQRTREGLIYRTFHKQYKKSIDKIMKSCSLVIAHTPYLARKYRNRFKVKATCIMTPSNSMDVVRTIPNNEIIYAGNLSINRHIGLIQIAQRLVRYGKKLVVYGNGEDRVISVLKAEKNIEYRGFINYDDLLVQIKGAKLIIHTESFEPFFIKDSIAAFSTKIADSLASGVPLFAYIPKEINITKYLTDNNCAYVCTKEEDLDKLMKLALLDEPSRIKTVENALKCVATNHNGSINAKKMKQLLEKIISA